jgi:hypothetical protein
VGEAKSGEPGWQRAGHAPGGEAVRSVQGDDHRPGHGGGRKRAARSETNTSVHLKSIWARVLVSFIFVLFLYIYIR